MEYIRIRDWPPEHASRAYDAGFFVEALQVLHGWVEVQARGLLIMVGSKHFNTPQSEIWDLVDQIPYKDVIKTLLVVGQVTKEEAETLLRINAVRNKLVHQIFKDPYEKRYEGIPRVEYDSAYKDARLWADKMLGKNEGLVE
jgi:hypothetical protein